MNAIKNILFLLILGTFVFSGDLAAQEKAYPKDGEGITLFLKRFNRTGEYYKKQFIELNRGKFGRNYGLLKHIKYTLPPLKESENAVGKNNKVKNQSSSAKKKNYEPLFGKNYANFEIVSNELSDACFYLVSGHGGPDPGAIGYVGKKELHEDEYAYDIVLRVARNLMMRGAKVHIIIQDSKDGIRDEYFLNNSKRETCMGSKIPLNQVQRLKQRCDKINSLYNKDKETYKRALFIHVDSRSKSKQTDVFFYHSGSSAGKHLARTMRNTFQKKYDKHQPGRGFSGTISKRDLYVIKNTAPTALFVELGNIQNKYDQQRIVQKNNRQALANWICEGFLSDYRKNK